MGALVRIYARYVIGIAAGALVMKGLIPQEVADILQQDTVITAVSTGFLAGSAFVVEFLYKRAKARGWSL